jgi:hypothetical protein
MLGGARPRRCRTTPPVRPRPRALETGGALKPEEGYKSMRPRDMPKTINTYPPPPSVAASEGSGAR